jgi:hypothetical protein
MMALMLACPMCFGAADSEQVHAAKIGVLVLLGFIVPLLAAIALIARSWARRAKALDSGLLGDHQLGEKREPLAAHPQPGV